MKLDVSFAELIACAERMGSFVPDFTPPSWGGSQLDDLDDTLSSVEGHTVTPEELETTDGLLGYRGRQVLLFIPDHGRYAANVLERRSLGNRFHLADCQTLNDMRSKQRFDRYKVTYNVSGKFEIFGTSFSDDTEVRGEAELKVCKFCLGYLNYRGYKNAAKDTQKEIFQSFDIGEFLSKYSTLFRSMPKREALVDMAGYADNWKDISRDLRDSRNWTCECCGVNLSNNRDLLHSHHINGVKRDNRPENLKALCIDCHRKQPQHDYMRVTHAQMQTINRLRKEQSLLQQDSWDELIDLADTSVTDLLRHYQAKGHAKPVVGHELQAPTGEVMAVFELAWSDKKTAIAIDREAISVGSQYGWRVFSVGDAIRNMNGVDVS